LEKEKNVNEYSRGALDSKEERVKVNGEPDAGTLE